MPKALTPAQQRVFNFLESRIVRGENAPTYREICKELGYRSPKAAADHVAALERKGYLIRERGRARSMKLTAKSSGVPLFGRISAGYPSDSPSELEAHLPIDPTAFGIRDRTKAFALRVRGDSMTGRQILDGDIVLVEQEQSPRNGEIVAAIIDNESTLKTLVRQDGGAWLRAENPLYPALVPAMGLAIQGVARAVIRILSL
ncbi:MAG: transcriptional repressor LexA [Terracidiphilus sp.]|jgi:repressor LexA